MAVKIRMARHGSRKQPHYRIVVADGRCARSGKFIEQLGVFDPFRDNGVLQLNQERFAHWTSKGAKPSHTLSRLIKRNAEKQA